MNQGPQIASSTIQQAVVLHLSGAMDSSSGPATSHLLAEATASAPPPSLIVLDLRPVELLTAEGVRTLRSFVHAARARGITCRLLVAPGGAAARALDIADPAGDLARCADLADCLSPTEPSPHMAAAASAGSITDRAGGTGLARLFSDMARSLQHEDNLSDTLNAITAAAVNTVPGAEYAGLMIVRNRRQIESLAVTAELATAVDQAQYATGEGPCLDALADRTVLRVTDMAHETRWPDFSRRAVQLGVRSMLSFQLYVTGDKLGGLNLYARRPQAFDDQSQQVGHLFAAHAAVAMAGAQREDHLNRAVSGRDIVGQAKGILMERYKITGDAAFQLLARASQCTNTKLTEVARLLSETGQLEQPRR